MDSTVVQEFSKKFQPQQESHVLWMKQVMTTLNEMKAGVVQVMSANPMNVKFSESNALDIVFIQFSLAMKYTKAILDGEAWVPPQKA